MSCLVLYRPVLSCLVLSFLGRNTKMVLATWSSVSWIASADEGTDMKESLDALAMLKSMKAAPSPASKDA